MEVYEAVMEDWCTQVMSLTPGIYFTERINEMISLKSIHPRTRQLNSITRNSKIKLTDLWVNYLWRNHSIDTFGEIRMGYEPVTWESPET